MRVLLDNMSQMLRGIVTSVVSSDPQCEIVVAPTGHNTLSDKLDASNADVVILAAANSRDESDQILALLTEHPAARVIAIMSGGDRAFLYYFQPHITLIDELSPATLLSAIKQLHRFAWREADVN